MIPEHLETERLKLRPFTPDDGKAVFAYWNSDPGWERFNASVPADYTEDDAHRFVAEFIARDRAIQPSWAMTMEGKVIGVVSVTFEQDHRVAVVGYGVHGEVRGQGLAAEATAVVIDAAFRTCPQLHRFRAHTDATNTASARVLEKLGFQCEGILRSNQYVNGELADEMIFGLLREEWH